MTCASKHRFETSWYGRSRADRIGALILVDLWLTGRASYDSVASLLATKNIQVDHAMTAYLQQAQSPTYQGPGTWIRRWMWSNKQQRVA